jgi:hypothetical protein
MPVPEVIHDDMRVRALNHDVGVDSLYRDIDFHACHTFAAVTWRIRTTKLHVVCGGNPMRDCAAQAAQRP